MDNHVLMLSIGQHVASELFTKNRLRVPLNSWQGQLTSEHESWTFGQPRLADLMYTVVEHTTAKLLTYHIC